MAQNVTLLFSGSITEGTVYNRLYSQDSGFQPADNQPLNSDAAVAVAIAGLVVSSAQLAIQIWQLYSEAKNAGKPINVTIISAAGEKTAVPSDNEKAVNEALETATTNTPPIS